MATKQIVESDKQNRDGSYTVKVSYHTEHNAHLVATTETNVRKTIQPSQLVIASIPDEHEKTAHPQRQSAFFSKLPFEIREKIYENLMQSPNTAEFFDKACDCMCLECHDRRRNESLGDLYIRSRGPVIRGQVKNDNVLNVLKTCRKMYDEARPILQQVNDLYIDGGIGRIPLLRDLIKPLSFHRGLRVPEAVLLSATFVLNKTSSSSHTNETVLEFAHAINRAYRSGPYLQIRKVTVILHLCEFTLLKDFELLMNALRIFQGVAKCTVEIKPKVKEIEFDDYMILRSITRVLEEGDVGHEDPMAEARQLLDDGYTGNVFTKDCRSEDESEDESVNNCFETVMHETKEFMAANLASMVLQSELDARALLFSPGDIAYYSRAALMLT